MEAITGRTYPTVGIENSRKIKSPIKNAATSILLPVTVNSTPETVAVPFSVKVAALEKPEYTDEQFYADIKKASNKLDLMESKALEAEAQGKTRKFPM